jgi:hypothetical protein
VKYSFLPVFKLLFMCRQTLKITNINAPAFGGAKVGKKVRKTEKSGKSESKIL